MTTRVGRFVRALTHPHPHPHPFLPQEFVVLGGGLHHVRASLPQRRQQPGHTRGSSPALPPSADKKRVRGGTSGPGTSNRDGG